jgi:hypothetical protein
MPLSNADYAKLLRLNCDHWALRLEFCFVKTELARRANFNPNQPRAPRGDPDGGQWTDGGGGGSGDAGSGQAQLISSRPRSGGTVRIGGRLVEATPAQRARLAVSDARARDAVRRVREIEPNWRPTPSLSEGVEGAILTNESVAREAETRLAEFGRQPDPPLPLRDFFGPGGQSVGARNRGAGDEIRTVSTAEFDRLLAQLMKDAQNIPPPSLTFPGQWYRRSDGTIFSVRISERHGVTIDIVRSNDPLILRPLKVHQK